MLLLAYMLMLLLLKIHNLKIIEVVIVYEFKDVSSKYSQEIMPYVPASVFLLNLFSVSLIELCS